MSDFETITHSLYLLAAASFVLGLHLMTSPATGRRGNLLSATGMAVAVVTTFGILAHDHVVTAPAMIVLTIGLLGGGLVGLAAALRVKMTAMPQLVSLFNAVGGGAAALIALTDAIKHPGSLQLSHLPVSTTLSTFLGLLIGSITFSGSLIAGGKLAGLIPGRPLTFPGSRALSVILAVVALASDVPTQPDMAAYPSSASSPQPRSSWASWAPCRSVAPTCRS
jgi:H+-translocating NAD(P) transhydrogenase subunit beta